MKFPFSSSRTILRRFPRLQLIPAFTLVELIVVITILAILATVGFLTLSGYTDDARSATVAANVRTVYSAILTESTTSGNSPRYYVDHDPAAALSGGIVFVDGGAVTLTGGQWGSGGTNYSAGNPRWDRLRMNGDKFRLSAVLRGLPGAFGIGGAGLAELAGAAYDTGAVSVGAFDYVGKAGVSGKARTAAYFQVAGVSPGTKKASVTGNYTAVGTGAVAGLVKDPGSASSTGAVVDGSAIVASGAGTPASCPSGYVSNGGACVFAFYSNTTDCVVKSTNSGVKNFIKCKTKQIPDTIPGEVKMVYGNSTDTFKNNAAALSAMGDMWIELYSANKGTYKYVYGYVGSGSTRTGGSSNVIVNNSWGETYYTIWHGAQGHELFHRFFVYNPGNNLSYQLYQGNGYPGNTWDGAGNGQGGMCNTDSDWTVSWNSSANVCLASSAADSTATVRIFNWNPR